MARLGRPKVRRGVTANFRLTEQEYNDLRRCAIAEETSMVDFLRASIKKCKRSHKAAGTWPEGIDRE